MKGLRSPIQTVARPDRFDAAPRIGPAARLGSGRVRTWLTVDEVSKVRERPAVALLGATGFIGQAVLDALLERGHRVKALARQPGRLVTRQGLEVIGGDASDAACLRAAVAGTGAVVSCLGTPRGEKQPVDFLARTMEAILEAMRAEGVTRLVAVSGAGISVPGERKPFPHRAVSALVRLLAPAAVEAKQREFGVLVEAKDVLWTAVRPTRVVAGQLTGHPHISTHPGAIGMRVSRGDLAEFIAAQVDDRSYIRAAPFISS